MATWARGFIAERCADASAVAVEFTPANPTACARNATPRHRLGAERSARVGDGASDEPVDLRERIPVGIAVPFILSGHGEVLTDLFAAQLGDDGQGHVDTGGDPG